MLPRFNKEKPNLNFSSRAEAFGYMLSYQIGKGADPLEASKRANEFAELFAQNMGIPMTIEPQPQGVDKYLSMATKIADYIEAHPKIVEYGIPAITFVAGLFTGKKAEQIEQRPDVPPQENIDFENIQD